MLSIKSIQEYTIETFRKYKKTWTNPRTYKTAAFDLSYQVGSLNKAIMQLDNDRFRNKLSDIQIKETIGDDLVDIMTLVTFIAHELDIDLEQARSQMIELDQNKINKRSESL